MGRFLAIDHGGSKTALLVFDERGQVILRCSDQGIFKSGERRALKWYQRVQRLLRRLPNEVRRGDFDDVTIALNGINTQDDLERVTKEAQRHIRFGRVQVVGDSIAALRGATSVAVKDVVRVVLYAGSGLNVTLVADGYPYRSLGWRIAPRDQGGYGIGRRIWETSLDAYNGIGKPTSLLRLLQEHFRCRPFPRLVAEVGCGHVPFIPEALPSLLFRAVSQNDDVAQRMVEDLSVRWLGYVDALVRDCCREPYPKIEVYLAGGIFKDRHSVMERSLKGCAKNLPYRVDVAVAEHEPVVGCALLRLDVAHKGEIPDDVLVNLRRTLRGRRNLLRFKDRA